MLKLLRIFIVTVCCILICVLGTVYSFIRFKNPSNVGIMARWVGSLHPLFGLKVEYRFPNSINKLSPTIYIGNNPRPRLRVPSGNIQIDKLSSLIR